MVKYYLVKVDEKFYDSNEDALKRFGKKAVCILKVNKLIQENQILIEQLKKSEKSKKILEEAKKVLEEAKVINEKTRALLLKK